MDEAEKDIVQMMRARFSHLADRDDATVLNVARHMHKRGELLPVLDHMGRITGLDWQ